MPGRIIPESLWESEAWLGLTDNTARVCWLRLVNEVSDLGTMQAGVARLRRLWRDWGVDTDEKVAAVLLQLLDRELIWCWDEDGIRYLEIPRHLIRFRVRHVTRAVVAPRSDNEDNQEVGGKTSDGRPTDDGRTTDGRLTVEKPNFSDSQVKPNTKPKPLNQSKTNSKSPKPALTGDKTRLLTEPSLFGDGDADGDPPNRGSIDPPSTSWFQAAVNAIVEQGSSKQGACSFIGGLRGEYGLELLNETIKSALAQPDVTNLRGYLKKALQAESKKRVPGGYDAEGFPDKPWQPW